MVPEDSTRIEKVSLAGKAALEAFKKLVADRVREMKANRPIEKRICTRLFSISGDEAVDDDWYIDRISRATAFADVIECMRSLSFDIGDVVDYLLKAAVPGITDEEIGQFALQDWDT